MFEKDFDGWNTTKKENDARVDIEKIFYREQEIWWCFLGINIGHEQDGKGENFLRPILIIKKFSRDTFIGVPLSTTKKKHLYLIECVSNDKVFRQAVINQLRVLDIRRLYEKTAFADERSFKNIRKAVRNMF